MNKRLVIALGGNALGKTPETQLAIVKGTAKTIADLCEQGYEIIIGHGNGTQVGMINLAMEFSAEKGIPYMPFPECGAMSQGYIGYHLQQAIRKELLDRGIQKNCVTLVTQVVVDETDPAFQNPTKPVGIFYSEEQAEKISKEKGFVFMEDSGRGYRRAVPSPMPRKIVELPVVEQLVNTGNIVITVGGGGIPVTEKGNVLEGIAAVIDKDRASCLLARELKADMLVILTAVEKVSLFFKTPQQKELDRMTADEAERYLQEGHFAPGSMGPKVEACVDFVRNSGPDACALITSLPKAAEALEGKTGTRIVR